MSIRLARDDGVSVIDMLSDAQVSQESQPIQSVSDVGNVFDVGLFEGKAGEGFQEVDSGTDALLGGGLEDFGSRSVSMGRGS